MATTSVRSLQGDEMLASYDAGDPMLDTIDSGEPKGPDIPLMPLVLRVHFVSCSTGEGIPSLRKTIYKVSVCEECLSCKYKLTRDKAMDVDSLDSVCVCMRVFVCLCVCRCAVEAPLHNWEPSLAPH